MTGIEKAIQKFGTGAAFGRALGFSKMTISNWKKTGIPPDHIRSVFELTRLRIPGAGASGADLITTVVRSPYVVDAVWVIDINTPVLTTTPDNMQIYAAEPVSFIEF